MTDIFQEVEEDVRREQLHRLWQRYGAYALALALLVVLGVGGMEFYRYSKGRRAEASAQAYLAASRQLETDPKAAADAFAVLAEKSGGYGVLSAFRAAEAKAATGDTAGAVALYDKIAADKRVDAVLRDLAILKSGYLMLEGASQSGLESRLSPLAYGTGPWRHAALEVLAFSALKAGDKAKARERVTALAHDETVPAGLGARARDMAATLEGAGASDAPAPPAPAPAAAPDEDPGTDKDPLDEPIKVPEPVLTPTP